MPVMVLVLRVLGVAVLVVGVAVLVMGVLLVVVLVRVRREAREDLRLRLLLRLVRLVLAVTS